jgi:hypothetical protein
MMHAFATETFEIDHSANKKTSFLGVHILCRQIIMGEMQTSYKRVFNLLKYVQGILIK